MNIHVGNLAAGVSESDLRQAFEAYGQVASAAVIRDRDTNQSRGFGFVEMPNEEEARAALGDLHGKDLQGKPLKLSEARTQGESGRGGRGSIGPREPGRGSRTGRGSMGEGERLEGRGSARDVEDVK